MHFLPSESTVIIGKFTNIASYYCLEKPWKARIFHGFLVTASTKDDN